jgi:hypothetical protein
MLGFNRAQMAKEAHASLRLTAELKREVAKISADEARPVSSVLSLLIEKGLAQYRADGHLKPTPAKTAAPGAPRDPHMREFADEIVDRVAARLFEIIEEAERHAPHQPVRKKRAA